MPGTFIVLIGEGVIRLWTTTADGFRGHSYGKFLVNRQPGAGLPEKNPLDA
jgi:hypothetical protein